MSTKKERKTNSNGEQKPNRSFKRRNPHRLVRRRQPNVQCGCNNQSLYGPVKRRKRRGYSQTGFQRPTGFSGSLIRTALIRALNSERVYLSSRQSMSIRVFLHTSRKRAETPALLDSGATENFINHRYAQSLNLPVKRLPNPRKVYNVDGTTNQREDILFYTDLEVRIGENRTNMRFFLTELGPQRIILGYPWFAAVQPQIDWAKGWLDYTQLPIVIRTLDAHRTRFTPRTRVGKVTIPPLQPKRIQLPSTYRQYEQV